jgi:hypothetical protein
MVTPIVTEILPPWQSARLTSRPVANAGNVRQRDLVIASLVAEGGRGDVYARRRPAATHPSDGRI